MAPRFAKTLIHLSVLSALILGPGLVTAADPGPPTTNPALASAEKKGSEPFSRVSYCVCEVSCLT
ncbi:hypothetical protein [uncultured Thiodictyon sp.]|uniref:hypothetical protein n=1 Tax=uncultured Thiodictyon sp. TaxID=1846217 RepID=UPI0025E5A5D4|nr:hypothetical protein [uncultured Thiodictyon sp.]